MSNTAIVALSIVFVLVGVAIFVPRMLDARAKKAASARCVGLKARLAGIAVQGGNPVLVRQLQEELRACLAESEAAGNTEDIIGSTIAACSANGEQMSQEWAHYRSTDWADTIARGNTRNTILRLGEEMARCYSMSIDDATTTADLNIIVPALTRQIAESESRQACFRNSLGGCGRFGWVEPHETDRADQERDRVTVPLRKALMKLEDKRYALDAVARKNGVQTGGVSAINSLAADRLRGML